MRSSRISWIPAGRRPVRSAARFALAAAPLLFLACEDDSTDSPLGPAVEPVETPAYVVVCRASVGEGTLACEAAGESGAETAGDGAANVVAGGAAGTGAEPLAGALTLGGQGTYVQLASPNVAYDPGTNIFSADVTVQNLIGQALATEDGAAGHVDGVRVFFHTGPVVTDGSAGTIEVNNEDGTATFTSADQPYFQYGGTLEAGGTDGSLGADGLLSPLETSAAKTWEWKLSATVQTFEFTVLVHGAIQFEDGWVDVVPAADTLVLGDPGTATVTLTATPRDRLGQPKATSTISWSSSDGAVATVDPSTGEVTAVAPGTATITATDDTISGTAEIVVAQDLMPDTYPETAVGNVGVNSADLSFSVTDNDTFESGATIAFAGWSGTAGSTEQGGTVSMTASGAGMGEFTYDPPAGYEGADRFVYVIVQDTATVSLTVADMVWFVDNGGACSIDCDGRLSHPLTSLAAFAAANDGGAGHPADGEAVFLYESGTAYTGPVTLRTGQALIGQDATATLASLTGLTPPSSSEPFPATNAANGTFATIAGGSGGVVLGSNNTLRGVTVATTGGTGISGSGFGTLTFAPDVVVDVSGGPALDLSTGALSGTFREISADGGTNGIVLSGTTGVLEVVGTGTAGSGGVIQNATGDGISLTNTGAVSLAWMTIQNNAGNGVRGDGVVGFTIRQGLVSGNGDAQDDDGLRFTALTGTARIDTTTVTGSHTANVYIGNSTGTLDLDVHGSTFSGPNGPSAGDRGGILIEVAGNATVDATAIDNQFSAHAGEHFLYDAENEAGGDVVFGENVLVGDGPGGLQGQDFDLFADGDAPPGWSGSITYDVYDNTVTGAHGSSIRVAMSTSQPSATMVGRVRDNTIGSTAPFSCSGIGISVDGNGNGMHTSAVTGNVIRNCGTDGINAVAGHGAGTFNLTVQGNDVANIGQDLEVGFGTGFYLLVGATSSNEFGGADTNTACLVLGHPTDPALKNSLDDGSIDGDYLIEQQGGNATLVLPALGAAAPVDYLNQRNTHLGGADASGDILGTPTIVDAASCPTPP